MKDYRLYLLDGAGRIGHRLDLECRDDAHAFEVVEAHGLREAAELWCGARQVRSFPAPKSRA